MCEQLDNYKVFGLDGIVEVSDGIVRVSSTQSGSICGKQVPDPLVSLETQSGRRRGADIVPEERKEGGREDRRKTRK